MPAFGRELSIALDLGLNGRCQRGATSLSTVRHSPSTPACAREGSVLGVIFHPKRGRWFRRGLAEKTSTILGVTRTLPAANFAPQGVQRRSFPQVHVRARGECLGGRGHFSPQKEDGGSTWSSRRGPSTIQGVTRTLPAANFAAP